MPITTRRRTIGFASGVAPSRRTAAGVSRGLDGYSRRTRRRPCAARVLASELEKATDKANRLGRRTPTAFSYRVSGARSCERSPTRFAADMASSPASTPSSDVVPLPLAPARARRCRCETPWHSEETCVRCGHFVRALASAAPPGEPPRPQTGDRWTRAGVVRALRAHEFFVGRPPTATDWSFENDSERPSVKTVISLFGSFEVAIVAAGLLSTPGRP